MFLVSAAETSLSSLRGLVGLAHLETTAAVGLSGGPPISGCFDSLSEIQTVSVLSSLSGFARAEDGHLAGFLGRR